jgi:hypothetical protein
MRLSLLALLSLASSVFSLPTEPHAGPPPARQQQAERRGEGGWGPVVQDPGTIVSLIPVRGADAALYAWTREGQDWEKLKRIVFVIHGKGRDPWNYLVRSVVESLSRRASEQRAAKEGWGAGAALWVKRCAGRLARKTEARSSRARSSSSSSSSC